MQIILRPPWLPSESLPGVCKLDFVLVDGKIISQNCEREGRNYAPQRHSNHREHSAACVIGHIFFARDFAGVHHSSGVRDELFPFHAKMNNLFLRIEPLSQTSISRIIATRCLSKLLAVREALQLTHHSPPLCTRHHPHTCALVAPAMTFSAAVRLLCVIHPLRL